MGFLQKCSTMLSCPLAKAHDLWSSTMQVRMQLCLCFLAVFNVFLLSRIYSLIDIPFVGNCQSKAESTPQDPVTADTELFSRNKEIYSV